jgi:hypothetical protein
VLWRPSKESRLCGPKIDWTNPITPL